MTFEEAVKNIRRQTGTQWKNAQKRWNSIAKPLHSLGKMETLVIRIAGITGSADIDIRKKALVAMCADNGVVEEGVTQTGQEVTAIVAENFLSGDTSACVMCRQCGTDVYPVDVGMAVDTKVSTEFKVMHGTHNMTKGPAMSREEAVKAIEAGIEMARRLKEAGYGILATGEMGIGNTTTSSAVAAVLLDRPVEEMTGPWRRSFQRGPSEEDQRHKNRCPYKRTGSFRSGGCAGQSGRSGYRRAGWRVPWRSGVPYPGGHGRIYFLRGGAGGTEDLSPRRRII